MSDEPTERNDSSESAPTKESVSRTLGVALLVSLVCSSLVASAAVVLKPLQVENERLDVQRNILAVAGLLDAEGDIDALFATVEPKLVDFETGEYVETIDPAVFDAEAAAKDPEQSVEVPPEIDRARIGRRPNVGLVYLVKDGDTIERIILPIYGYGLWSTMYGFLALEPDANTVADITFYAHGETAGLGDQVASPSWQALWRGKRVYGESGEVELQVGKGSVPKGDPNATYRVDGISGATLTGNGVTYLIQYWLGEHGYGPYLDEVRERTSS